MNKTNLCIFLMTIMSLFSLMLSACGFRESQKSDIHDNGNQLNHEIQTPTSSATESIKPLDTIETDSSTCQDDFIARELLEPYQRHERDVPRYTLSENELLDFYDLMGIETICLPPQYGPPFINVDWDSEEIPATGRMASIGFEDLYGGGGWSSLYLLYSTYDFAVGSEYDVFASQEDYENIQDGSFQNPVMIDGVKGFVRFHAGIPMGMQMIMKTYIFPFQDYYIAAVVNIGAYDPAQIEAILIKMESGDHPDLITEDIHLMDLMVSSIKFK